MVGGKGLRRYNKTSFITDFMEAFTDGGSY